MPEYRVTWEIDVEAKSPREAAEKALKTQRTKGSGAVVFDTFNMTLGGDTVRVDLDAEEDDDA